MKKKNTTRHLTTPKWKTAIAAFSVICAGTLLFNFCTEAAMAAELGKTQTVPTTYTIPSAPQAVNNHADSSAADLPQASYTVKTDSLSKDTPTQKDLTREEAAQLGAQLLSDVYGLDLNQAAIYMLYSNATESFPRATWTGTVTFDGAPAPERTMYTFWIDAVTGETFSVAYSRKLNVDVPLGLDASLEKNNAAYQELARSLAEAHHFVSGFVSSVSYNCQGYSNNDPDITFDVYGENGEHALVTFSRYDQAIKGVSFDTANRISEQALEKMMRDLEKSAKEMG